MTDQPFLFHDYPAEKFPFTMSAYAEHSVQDTDPLWTREVDGPGATSVPGVAETGQRVRIVIEYADGTEDRFGS